VRTDGKPIDRRTARRALPDDGRLTIPERSSDRPGYQCSPRCTYPRTTFQANKWCRSAAVPASDVREHDGRPTATGRTFRARPQGRGCNLLGRVADRVDGGGVMQSLGVHRTPHEWVIAWQTLRVPLEWAPEQTRTIVATTGVGPPPGRVRIGHQCRHGRDVRRPPADGGSPSGTGLRWMGFHALSRCREHPDYPSRALPALGVAGGCGSARLGPRGPNLSSTSRRKTGTAAGAAIPSRT
jgi:hypothetical protein